MTQFWHCDTFSEDFFGTYLKKIRGQHAGASQIILTAQTDYDTCR